MHALPTTAARALLPALGLLALACSGPDARTAVPDEVASDPTSGAADLLRYLGCGACHAGVPDAEAIRDRAPPLGAAGRPLAPSFLLGYLRDPRPIRPDIAPSRMPDFHLDSAESLALALFLAADDERTVDPDGDDGARGAGTPEEARTFRTFRESRPEVDATRGREIFRALNCAGCHRHPDVEPRRVGPDLTREASRVREGWLRDWLAAPSAVRPFGIRPGVGGRMPDFGLADAEVDSVVAYLLSPAEDGTPEPGSAARDAAGPDDPGAFRPRDLSAYERGKAEALLRERLSCLGCHRLGDDGGRIGPDLTRAGARLRPSYLHAIIAAPDRAAPGTIMPRVPMTAERRHLIASYLATGAGSPAGNGAPPREERATGDRVGMERAGYLSLVDHRPRIPGSPASAPDAEGETLYASHCAACHGREGEGDGFNARHLPVAATAHAYAPYISTRPDATLYDGIHAGGRILNRSHRMPPFGESLEPAQIRSLVEHIRELCDCVGPAWSR